MALATLDTHYKYYIIGWRRYSFNGNEGCSLVCVNDFDVNNSDQSGSNVTPVSAPFGDAHKLEAVGMFLGEPAIIEFYGLLVNRQGNSVLVATEILKITPTTDPKGQAKPKPT